MNLSIVKREIGDELRMLLFQKQCKLMKKKADSSLIKYLDNGTFICIVCKSVIKNKSIWSIHVNTKQHRDNVVHKKEPYPTKPIDTSNLVKNLAKHIENISNFYSSSVKLKGIWKNKLFAILNEISKDDEDFSNKMEVDDVESTSELPEGFFDDPVLDAKARNVDYKNPIEEWGRLQKKIEEVSDQISEISDQNSDEELEEATVDRIIEIIDENIQLCSKLRIYEETIEKIQEESASARKTVGNLPLVKVDGDDDLSYGSEEEFEEYIDWRSKQSFK